MDDVRYHAELRAKIKYFEMCVKVYRGWINNKEPAYTNRRFRRKKINVLTSIPN